MKKSIISFLMLDKLWDGMLLTLGIVKFAFILYFPYPSKTERYQKFQLRLLSFLIKEKMKEVNKPFEIYEWDLDNYFFTISGKFLKNNECLTNDEFKKMILRDFSLKETDIYIQS
ncbi:hypothetical protein HYW87_05060, partial [Candidatus Roizmanbacteria bacterium]|nr:hypothetical protein [Candidatus Roizmanbacteria bacterium]